jgi:hypothetical protein
VMAKNKYSYWKYCKSSHKIREGGKNAIFFPGEFIMSWELACNLIMYHDCKTGMLHSKQQNNAKR